MEFPNCPNFDLFFGWQRCPFSPGPGILPGPMPRPPAAAAGAGRPCAVSAERRAAEPGPRLLPDGAPGPGRAAAVPGGDPSALGALGALGWG